MLNPASCSFKHQVVLRLEGFDQIDNCRVALLDKLALFLLLQAPSASGLGLKTDVLQIEPEIVKDLHRGLV